MDIHDGASRRSILRSTKEQCDYAPSQSLPPFNLRNLRNLWINPPDLIQEAGAREARLRSWRAMRAVLRSILRISRRSAGPSLRTPR